MTNKKRRQKIANYETWSDRDLRMLRLRLDTLGDEGEEEFARLKSFSRRTGISMLQAGVNAMGFASEDRRLAQKFANKFGALPWINRNTRHMDLNWRDRVR